MPRTLLSVWIVISMVPPLFGQYGTAPNNYYPMKYTGSIFSGEVIEANSDQISMTYTKKGKTDTFAGRFEAPCSIPSADGRGMTTSEIPKGTVVTAFFDAETKKVDGQKLKENIVLALAFDVWNGVKTPENSRRIYFCTNDRHLHFRAWGN